ncbi:D-amino acid dehydrogenase small subunit [Quillaja saponaria]|uniref:D-amino acid dehydrogenase small subunit n=1 Tax=Quillaja saponaria TaxID=32244 RepID=A0AAD7VL02_QUISA|nr:D-amino acid dehydrogenase small subunit [Quillaja saponaria]
MFMVESTNTRRLAHPSRNVLWVSVPFLPRACSSLHFLSLPFSSLLVYINIFTHSGGGGGSRGGYGRAGGGGGGDSGLLKLRDDVRMCGYGDVQVMWNMLSSTQAEQMEATAEGGGSRTQ